MNDYDPGDPTWRYRRNAFGKLESQVFGSNEIPKGEGWVDTPTRIADPPKPIPEPVPVTPEMQEAAEFHIGSGETLDVGSNPPKKRGRPRKVRDGDNG